MEVFLEKPLPFQRLAGILTEELAREVVEEAWRVYLQMPEGSSPPRSALKAAIRQHLYIPGFRPGQAHRAPAARLKQALMEEWRFYEDMVQAVFRLWAEARKELISQVTAFLQEAGLPAKGLDGPELVGYWKWAEFQAWVDRFRETFPEAGTEDEVRLAIALVTGRLPLPDEVYDQIAEIFSGESEMPKNFWTRVLEEMRSLPHEAPEWETLDEFLQAAREIGEEKQRERAIRLRRNALQEALEAFRAGWGQWIEFFQMHQCAAWSADACLPDQIENVYSTLRDLESLIGQYETLYNSRPSTMMERRERERQLAELEEKVLALYADLNGRLAFQEMTPSLAEEMLTEEVEGSAEEEAGVPEEVPVPEVSLPFEETPGEVAPEMEETLLLSESEEVASGPVEEEEAISEAPVLPVEARPVEEEEKVVPEAPVLPAETRPVEEEAEAMPVEVEPTEAQPVSPSAETLEEEANRLLVSMLNEGDILTGYWLAWAMEHQGLKPRIPSLLIQAVQGSFWAMRVWPEVPIRILDDMRFIPQQMPAPQSRVEQWMGAAAALYLALVAPLDGWGDWLNLSAEDIPALKDLAASVRSFAALGWPLQPEDVISTRRKEAREQAIQALAEEARRWLEGAPNRRTNYQRASAVWRYMTRPQGDLYEWFVLVAQDQRQNLDKVQQALENWRNEGWVDDRIQEIDLELVGRRLSPIEGVARKQIIRWVGEACELSEKWVRAVVLERQLAQRGEWLQEQLHMLLRQVIQALPEIDQRIGEVLASLPEYEAEFAALSLLRRSVLALKRIFTLPDSALPVGVNDVEEGALRERSFQENLAERLLRYPEALVLGMDNDGDIVLQTQNAGNLLRMLLDPSLRSRSPEDIVARWIELRDYRFMDNLLATLFPPEDPRREILEARWREAFRSDLRSLNEEVGTAMAAVEQALIDGLISESERTRYTGVIEAVRKEISRIGQSLETGRHRLNIREFWERLGAIYGELEEKRRSRLAGQRRRWAQVQEPLASVLSQDQFQRVRWALEGALERGEIRVVDEYLVGLEDALQGKREALDPLLTPVERKDRLQEFREAIQPLTEVLNKYELPEIARRIVKEETYLGDLGLPHLPKSRKLEIARALLAWHYLKRNQVLKDSAEEFRRVADLMRYLGFRVQETSAVSLVRREPGLRHWRIRAIPERSELVPVPEFGSKLNGEYDVIGIWDRPGFNLMSALVERTADRPAIVFYFGRLLKRQREDLLNSDALRFMRVPVLVLDETLLLFLAREYDVRMEAFFACTLPYTSLNPYVPFAAGSVPPEMFVGRKEAIAKLLDPLGPAIVYGGRQLGKSALLRQVWREFHDGSRNFAILEDIKSVGDPRSGHDYERAFWGRLVEAVNRVGFLDVPSNISPERLLERIRQQISERGYRLLLLLDEADNFLEADSGNNFRVVGALKRLMDDTERQFKVMFAGLHNVQRFQRIPNQPLAHLGQPIEIGPLEPEAARELLERPLRALGFRFGEDPLNEDPSVVLYVLSYTNYHPGLIQLFAKELVDRLRSTRRAGLPPFGVTRADVETVYRQPEVRQAIRERFTWTLALDERYEAIALAMILDQWDARDGFDRLYRSGEIRNLVQEWWPAGFEGMEQDQFRGYLDEMCGLGVLDRARVNGEDRYRLRSPNVVQLMGTYEELWERLDEITRKAPAPPLRLESHHALLDKAVYSPLTYAQEGSLRNSRTGVGLVFGSEALQIRYLKEVTRRFVEFLPASSSAQKDWEEIRISSKTGKALMAWLEDRKKEGRGSNLRVFFRDLETAFWTPEELEEQVQAALRFCSGHSWARVIFAFGPMAAWQWFQLPWERRENLEENVGGVVAIRPWDLVGIRQRLEQHKPELMSHDRHCRRVHEVTGGWPFLLDEFLQRCRTDTDPIPPLEQFAKELTQPDHPIRRKFLESLQIPPGVPERLVTRLHREQQDRGGEDYWVPRDVVYLLVEEEAAPPQLVDAAVEYLLRMAVLRQRLAKQSLRTRREPDKEVSLDPTVYRLWTERQSI
ncbi:MAG: hypothetical protein H5T61_09575 [Thermoflexales bacterium]|nr:hypothetical protein [Thermoflexales bacterium]